MAGSAFGLGYGIEDWYKTAIRPTGQGSRRGTSCGMTEPSSPWDRPWRTGSILAGSPWRSVPTGRRPEAARGPSEKGVGHCPSGQYLGLHAVTGIGDGLSTAPMAPDMALPFFGPDRSWRTDAPY